MIKFYSLAEDAAQRLENFLKQNDCKYTITEDEEYNRNVTIQVFHQMAMMVFNDSVSFISENAKSIDIDLSEFAAVKTL